MATARIDIRLNDDLKVKAEKSLGFVGHEKLDGIHCQTDG